MNNQYVVVVIKSDTMSREDIISGLRQAMSGGPSYDIILEEAVTVNENTGRVSLSSKAILSEDD